MQPSPSPAVAAVFEPVQTATTFEETVERLGTAIRLGLLAPGERLPPERDLADQLGIARSTLRQALTALTESGHLIALRGRGGGTFVSAAPPLAEASRADLEGGHWREAFQSGTVKASGPPEILRLIANVVEKQEERTRSRKLRAR